MSEQWSRFAAAHRTGDVVHGLVTKAVPFGAFVEIDGVTGLMTGPARPAPGTRVTVRVTAIDAGRRRFAAEGV